MPAKDKVVGLHDLVVGLQAERAEGKTVVFTNGCFDLLHAGHLHLLEAAAALGDLLVVGLNGDATVRALKGAGRPIVPFDERALLVAGLECVHRVTGFDDPTPLELIRAVQPDVLVKGADWPVEQIVGRDIVEARGGKVVSLALLPDRSTSDLIATIRKGDIPL